MTETGRIAQKQKHKTEGRKEKNPGARGSNISTVYKKISVYRTKTF